MNNDQIIQMIVQLERLTSAVLLMAKTTGTRLNRAQLSARLGIHRNTLAKQMLKPGFPTPDRNGYWLLEDVIQWEQYH